LKYTNVSQFQANLAEFVRIFAEKEADRTRRKELVAQINNAFTTVVAADATHASTSAAGCAGIGGKSPASSGEVNPPLMNVSGISSLSATAPRQPNLTNQCPQLRSKVAVTLPRMLDEFQENFRKRSFGNDDGARDGTIKPPVGRTTPDGQHLEQRKVEKYKYPLKDTYGSKHAEASSAAASPTQTLCGGQLPSSASMYIDALCAGACAHAELIQLAHSKAERLLQRQHFPDDFPAEAESIIGTELSHNLLP
jgi:hypothetical protein